MRKMFSLSQENKDNELYDSDGNIISESCLADFLRGDKKDCMYVEKTLTSEERNKLKDSDFGIPELRKYPLIDKSHVLSAMRYFKDCPEKYKAELAKRIQAKVDKFNLGVNKAGEYYKYIHQDVITESFVNESSILLYGENDIIQESTKYQKKYKCPFCEFRETREKIVDHVEDEHQDMIPQDFTPARVVFNYINHKEHGTCIVCGRETKWREENRKYARLCGRKECSKALSDKADENLKRVTGMTAKEMLKNPEFQNKMLKGRSISGVYTFTDGGKRDYVGSYEKNILEYFDKTLHAHSSEVMTPGPVVEYVYKGERHFWITDIYYITANLAIDAKDGGSNPNNRNMEEYREKQIAKEKAITDQGKYNYLRLTDNNFAQLLQILAELKYMMLDDDNNVKPISRIHEYTALGGMNPVIGSSGNYIVNYGINNTLIGQAYTNDKAMSKLFIIKDDKIQRTDTKEFIENYDYTLYKHDSENSIVKDIEEMMYNESEVEEGFFLKRLCNIDNDKGMIWVNEHFEEVDSMYDYYAKVHEIIENSLIQEWNKSIGESTPSIECLSEEAYSGRDIIFKEDMNGVYAENVNTNMRTGYYENVSEISDTMLKLLREC